MKLKDEINKLKEQLNQLKPESDETLSEAPKKRPFIRLKKVTNPPPIPKTSLPESDNLCIDCSEPILPESIRCNPCNNKHRFLQNKEGRPTYEQILKDKAELFNHIFRQRYRLLKDNLICLC